MITPSWLSWARTQIGTKEIVGPKHNQTVLDYWKLGRIALDVRDDELAWCAAFVAACLEVTGHRSTRSGRARSYVDPTFFVDCDWKLGAIVCLSSSAGPANGHVGFLEAVTDTHVFLCGGNQGNAVSVAPFERKRVLRKCWPKAAASASHYLSAPISLTSPVSQTTDR